jgi:L-ascorbate metabolism protein UlaG (beta-lactamase superfamily)
MFVKWLGHASFLIKTQEKNIYIDPYVGDYSEKADVVLVTHGHRDHCDLGKLSMIRTDETVVLTSEQCAGEIPQDNVKTMSPGETEEINGIKVHAVEAHNLKRFRSPGVPYHPQGTQVGFVVESEGKRVYHAGDTDFLPSMKELGGITLALVPIGGTYTMDIDEAVEAIAAFQPEMVVPMHRRESNLKVFKEKVESQSETKLLEMTEGEEITL